MDVIGAGATFNSIVNTGSVHVTDGTTLTLQGTINNETYHDGVPIHHTPATLALDSIEDGKKRLPW